MGQVLTGVAVFHQPLDLGARLLELVFQAVVLVAKLGQRFVKLAQQLVLVGDGFFKVNKADLVVVAGRCGHFCQTLPILDLNVEVT